MYIFNFRSWKHKAQTFLEGLKMFSQGRSCVANLFEKERSQSVRVLQTFLQLSKEETKDAEVL